MSELKIAQVKASSDKALNDIYNFNVQVFAGSQDFEWTKDNLKNEMKDGWDIFSVNIDKDIICALFVKNDKDKLLTKNTPIKMNFQGNGFSHIIKDFYEDYAKEYGITTVINYCPDDNFRMISLNEGHGYKRTGNTLKNASNMIEWVKELKKV